MRLYRQPANHSMALCSKLSRSAVPPALSLGTVLLALSQHILKTPWVHDLTLLPQKRLAELGGINNPDKGRANAVSSHAEIVRWKSYKKKIIWSICFLLNI